MQILVGNPAPDFTAKAIMPDNNIEFEFNLRHHVKNHKSVLFFYPLDFTFVCPSEIIAFNNRLSEFTERETKIIAVSVDSHFSHLAWKNTPTNKGGIGNIQIPMVSDITKSISTAYNVLNDGGISLRATFLIDTNFTVRHMLINDPSIGRNIDETLRMIDALDYHVKYGEVCPAGWQKGQEAITPSQKGIADYLASNAEKL
jgi:peroxiredoxin (alkyl hydroperoxide reductase subunit C)